MAPNMHYHQKKKKDKKKDREREREKICVLCMGNKLGSLCVLKLQTVGLYIDFMFLVSDPFSNI